jgi:hypothetical protein
VADAEGVTMAEVIRRALDAYFVAQRQAFDVALAASFGADPNSRAPERAEWDRG